MTATAIRKPSLLPMEARVIRLSAQGLTYAQIGKRLDMSEAAVKSLMARARQRLQASSVGHAIAIAIGAGLVPADVAVRNHKHTSSGGAR